MVQIEHVSIRTVLSNGLELVVPVKELLTPHSLVIQPDDVVEPVAEANELLKRIKEAYP